VQDFFPEARLGLERPFRFFPNEKLDPISSKEAMLAVALSCPDGGIDGKELEAIMGTRSARAIQSLIDAEILCRHEERVKLTADYFFDPNPERVLRWMGYVLDLFDRERSDQMGNFTSLRIEGLNDKGIEKLQEVMTLAEKSIQGILDDKNCRGSQSVATVVVSTVLNPKAPSP
jgi:hypothetical protein